MSSSIQSTPPFVECSYVEDLNSIEDVMRYSTNIVKAKLTSVEDFDGTLGVYIFDVLEDYTDNTQSEIHMYDAYNDAYMVGHTYYLFLSSSESALFPHTIYTTVVKELIIDEATTSDVVTASINSSELTVFSDGIEEQIEGAAAQGTVAEYTDAPIFVSNADDIVTAANLADVIAEVSVSNEVNANIYSSTYALNVVAMIKGPVTAVPASISLPPDLDPNATYYILLKETPDGDGTYSLCSRAYPAVYSASNIAEDLLTSQQK